MHEEYCALNELPHNKTINIYEFLSKIIANFTKLMSLAHRILLIQYGDESFLKQQTMDQFQKHLQYQLILENAKQTEYTEETGSPSIVNKRFINRLIETILPYKQKALQYNHLKPLSGIIEQIQRSLTIFHKNQQLSQLIKSLHQNFSAFYSIIKALGRFQKFQVVLSSHESDRRSNSIRQPMSATLKIESESSKQYKKLLLNLNSRFRSLGNLDLDYGHYRRSYFQVINKEDLYSDYIQRNQQIKTQILQYRKGFKQYTSRKERRRIEKRLSFNLKKQPKETKKNFYQINIAQKRFTTKHIDTQTSESHKRNRQYEKRWSLKDQQQESQKKSNASPLKKTEIRMKKIVITVNKKKDSIKQLGPHIYNPIKFASEGHRKKGKRKEQRFSLMKDLENVRKNFKMQ